MPAALRWRLPATGLALLALAAATGCREVEAEEAAHYAPSKVEHVDAGGRDDARITFTAEGARRVDLQTAPVRSRRGRTFLPHAALLYDPDGAAFVYTSPKPLTYARAEAEVERVDGARVWLATGPRPGTRVVTVGAAQVHGAELAIEGGH